MSTLLGRLALAGESTDGVSRPEAFDVLSARRRRHVLHYLLQSGATVDLRDLSERVAAWENGVRAEAVTYKQRMRVYTALRQTHLPKMDEAGIVEFDKDRSTISLTDHGTDLEVYLDVVPNDDIPWSRYYLGLSALSAGLLLLVGLSVFPFGLLSGLQAAAVSTALFAASSVAHAYRSRRMELGREGPPPDAPQE